MISKYGMNNAVKRMLYANKSLVTGTMSWLFHVNRRDETVIFDFFSQFVKQLECICGFKYDG